MIFLVVTVLVVSHTHTQACMPTHAHTHTHTHICTHTHTHMHTHTHTHTHMHTHTHTHMHTYTHTCMHDSIFLFSFNRLCALTHGEKAGNGMHLFLNGCTFCYSVWNVLLLSHFVFKKLDLKNNN